MNLRPEVLGRAGVQALGEVFKALPSDSFYLGGGTAVALQFGHRVSLDVDLFTPEKIDDPLALASILVGNGLDFNTDETGFGALHGRVRELRVTFLHYNYPLLDEPIYWPETGARIASLADLACMKLAAIASRGSRKDFVDIHALCLSFKPLPELLDLYRRKYQREDFVHLLYALVYFEDAERESMPEMLNDTNWEAVKRDMLKWAGEIVKFE